MRLKRGGDRVAVGVAALALILASSASAAGDESIEQEAASPPNVLVIMTDDQTARDLRFMPRVERLAKGGTTFRNAFASYPLCCPSRATFLTGQHAHNHGVEENEGPDGGIEALDQSETLPVWLRRAGYRTAYVGKYLNGYLGGIPPGWDSFVGTLKPNTSMYDYPLSLNGVSRLYGGTPRDYKTDVLADLAVEATSHLVRGGPFFLTFAPSAPHLEDLSSDAPRDPRPAQRHMGLHEDEPLPKRPSFNEKDVRDKPGHIQEIGPILDAKFKRMKARYRGRIESLLAVDEAVEKLVDALREGGELANTLIVFESDNGVLLGEHRITSGKRYPYEESIRVPLILRGPGVPPRVTRGQLVSNVDVAATILDATGATPGRPQDGRSLLPLARSSDRAAKRDVLIEGRLEHGDRAYSAVRGSRYVYIDWSSGEQELYDLKRDPFELDSRHDDPAYETVEGNLRQRLRELRDCVGAECR